MHAQSPEARSANRVYLYKFLCFGRRQRFALVSPQVGIAAPILLVITRVVQGFAVGGEFTSTIVFLVEHAPPTRRGLMGSLAFVRWGHWVVKAVDTQLESWWRLL